MSYPKITKTEMFESGIVLDITTSVTNQNIGIFPRLKHKKMESEIIIKDILNEQLEMQKFAWNKGLNYRDFILAVWRTLLRQDNTKERANKVKLLVGEENALKLISEQIKIEI